MHEPTISTTYLVSDKITPVSGEKLLELEQFVGGVLPSGYPEYLQRFGTRGEYNHSLSVWPPEWILEFTGKERSSYAEQMIKDKHEYHIDTPLTDDDLKGFFPFGSAMDESNLIYIARFPREIFLYHHEDTTAIPRITSGFNDPLLLTTFGKQVDCFRYFIPEGDHVQHRVISLRTTLSTEELSKRVTDYWRRDEVHRVEMPEDYYGEDVFFVFVREIGALFSIVCHESDNKGIPYVKATFDKEHADKIAAFAVAITEAVT